MIRVLFVCHGNICRSPMAEFVMKDYVEKIGKSKDFLIESAGTSSEELGNSVYPPVRKLLAEKGIITEGKIARKLRKEDYDKYDYIIGMDIANRRNMYRLFGDDSENKISLLLEFIGSKGEVDDPWYTGAYERTYEEVTQGTKAILESIYNETFDL